MNLTGGKGLVLDAEAVLGELRMSGLRGEVMERDSQGDVTENVKKLKYDLVSVGQGMMIQVGVPAGAPIKDFKGGEIVKLVNPEFGAVAEATFSGATVEWYINAENIIAVGSQAGNMGGGGKPNEVKHGENKNKSDM